LVLTQEWHRIAYFVPMVPLRIYSLATRKKGTKWDKNATTNICFTATL